MKAEQSELNKILEYLYTQRGFDFNGYRRSMLERRIQKRIYETKTTDLEGYKKYLHLHSEELDQLIDVLTINVSRFFRNSLSFEYLRKLIVPNILADNIEENDSFRIWSAGCANGEEPYSIAILLNELNEKDKYQLKPVIFATDIDHKALKKASVGSYGLSSVKSMKYGLVKKYFTIEEDNYRIIPEIKQQVKFSLYDLMNKTQSSPPESIFGNFDLVFCRNVLIYFEMEYQNIIFNKLYNSLKPNGYLILGEAEIPVDGFKHKFRRVNNCCKIYQKMGE